MNKVDVNVNMNTLYSYANQWPSILKFNVKLLRGVSLIKGAAWNLSLETLITIGNLGTTTEFRVNTQGKQMQIDISQKLLNDMEMSGPVFCGVA